MVKTKQIQLNDYPEVLNHLIKNQWNVKDGHPNQNNIMDQFKQAMRQCPDTITGIMDKDPNLLKLMASGITEAQSQKQHVICLRVPKLARLLQTSAEGNPRKRPKKEDYERATSSQELSSGEEEISELEIEQTTAMVMDWVRKGWFRPSKNLPLLVFPESESDETGFQPIAPDQIRRRPDRTAWRLRRAKTGGKTLKTNNYPLSVDSDTQDNSEDEASS